MNLTHEEILNQILYTTCPLRSEGHQREFEIETLSTYIHIKAEYLGEDFIPTDSPRYKILSFKITDK